MKKPTVNQIIAKLRRKPGKTASELGVTNIHMHRLASKGLVEKMEEPRRNGKRGRPASQWVAVA